MTQKIRRVFSMVRSLFCHALPIWLLHLKWFMMAKSFRAFVLVWLATVHALGAEIRGPSYLCSFLVLLDDRSVEVHYDVSCYLHFSSQVPRRITILVQSLASTVGAVRNPQLLLFILVGYHQGLGSWVCTSPSLESFFFLQPISRCHLRIIRSIQAPAERVIFNYVSCPALC